MVSLIVIDMLFGCDHNKCKFGNYGLFWNKKLEASSGSEINYINFLI